jgi:ABC-type lipoprotein release transport system permease subunit
VTTYIKIAWRNLWRNSRRTLITAASIFFGIFFAVLMTSMQQGTMGNMVDNMVRFYSGYLQVQEEGFKENRSVNQSFIPGKKMQDALDSNSHITQSTTRIESFALASSGSNSNGSLLFGIDPEQEEAISGLSKWIKEGEFLEPGSKDVLVGKILAQNLNLSINDTIVLIGQGYHGISTAGIYRIAGLLDFPLPELSKQVVYMDIHNCQKYLGMPDRVTSAVIMVNSADEVSPLNKSLASAIAIN